MDANKEARVEKRIDEFMLVIDDMEGESDRGFALIMVSYIDELLVDLIKGLLIKGKTTAAMLKSCGNGILATFFSRIQMAYSLGLINKREKQALDKMSEIRNHFAHLWKKLDFDSKEISKMIGTIPVKPDDQTKEPRELFAYAAGYLGGKMIRGIEDVKEYKNNLNTVLHD